jgi:hypothetical protein
MILNYLPYADRTRRWLKRNPQLWMRLMIILGVLLFSTVLPRVGALQRYTRYLLVLPFAVAGGLIMLRSLPLGLIVVIGSMLLRYSGPSNLNATMMLVALLLGLWILEMLAGRRNIIFLSSRVFRPLLYFLVVAVLSFIAGQLPWYSFVSRAPMGAQLAGLSIFVLSAGAFVLVAHEIRDERWLERMVGLFLVLGALFVGGQLLGSQGQFITRLFPGSATGSMFWVWLAALSFSQAAFNKRLPLVWRTALAILLLGTLYVAYVQNNGWKSGWLPALSTVVAIVGLRSWRIGLAMAFFGLLLIPDLLSQVISTDLYSYSTRIDAWIIIAEIIKVNPILGLGPSNYRWYTPLFPIRGYAVQFNSHNQYVDLVAQSGLLGLAFFLWFFAEVGRLGLRLRTRVPDGFARAYVYGALGGLVGTLTSAMLGDWVLPFFYNVTLGGFRASVLPWLFLGGLVALERMYDQRQPSSTRREIVQVDVPRFRT